MLNLIFNQKINLSQISNEFLLNRLTILSDIKEIKNILKEFDLELESIPWKGVVLKGNHENILDFSIKFLMYFYIKKIDNYNLSLFYYTFVNSKSIEYIRGLINCDLESKILEMENLSDDAIRYLKSKKLSSNINIFFDYIEKNLKINLSEENKSYLIHTINKGALKKFFNYSEYKIPETIDSYIFFYIKNKIEKKMIELFPLLSTEDIFNVLVYIKNICLKFLRAIFLVF